MVNYANFKNSLPISKTDKVVTVPLHNESFNKSIENTMYLEVYSNLSCEVELFSTDNVVVVPIGAKSIQLDLSFLDAINADNIVIVIGISGSFSKKYILKER